MSERISVTITAQDGASKTFTAIGNSAQKMGDQIESAGKEGTAGLKTIDTQAKTTSQSMDDIREKATLVGAAFGTLVSAAALLGANYRDQQRQIDGINRTYGDQADAILAITEEIQDLTRFSNDAARESALLGTALVDAYGLSADQVGVLIERSADLAQIYGIELPDAFARVSGAIRGEGEAAERLGLNMSDAAIAARALDAGITNWNVPGAISEAEKAAFRFQVLLEDTQQTVGAAADAADTAGGGFRQFVNSVDDAAESLGGFLGPVGEVAAEFAPILIALPIAGAGFGRLAGLLGTMGTSASTASFSIATLGLRMGALGIALTAIGLAGVGVYKIFQNIQDSASGVAEGIGLLTAEIERLKLAADPAAAEQVQTMVDAIQAQVDLLSGSDWAVIRENLGLPEGTEFIDITGPDGLADQIKTAGQLMDDFAEHVIATANSITDPAARQRYLDWVNQLLTTVEHTVDGSNLDDIINEVLTTPASEVPGVLDAIATSADGAAAALDGLGTSFGLLAIDSYGQIRAAQEASREYAELTKNVEAFEDATQDFLGNGDNILDFWLQYQENIDAANAGLQATFDTQQELDAYNAAQAEDARFRGLVGVADDLNDSADALEGVLRTFEQIDAIGQRSASAGSIADNLIGEPGVWATIDDLLANGAISLNTYNEALSSGVAIQESNVRVQEDLNAIRAAQLPLLAQAQVAYEANIDRISKMGAEEQRLTLALQDSSMQAQIAAQYATAYSASLGEIPPEVATRMIVEASEADPMLKEILLNLGLISETEGVITVNFPDGPTVQETIIALTESLDQLFTLISGGDHVIHIGAEDEATPVIQQAIEWGRVWDDTQSEADLTANNSSALASTSQAQSAANTFDNTVATATLNVNDAASSVISGAIGLANAFAGKVATATIRTVYETVGSPAGVGPTRQHGGILGFASGGVMFRGAEAGPEMLHYASGGSTPIYHDGLYTAPANTYVSPANANPGLSGGGGGVVANFNNYAPIYGVDDLNDRFRDFAVSIRDDLLRHQTAQGVMA